MKTSARDTTNYAKGIAIAIVLVVHYMSYYAYAYYSDGIAIVASEAVAVFFILSGLGIFYSLEKNFNRDEGLSRRLYEFYLRRALRIYPLYWLALFITPFVLERDYVVLHQPSIDTIGIYLGIPYFHPPGVFWFIPAILQCYVAAPLLYVVLKKVRPASYLILAAIAIAASVLVTILLVSLQHSGALTLDDWTGLFYRDLIFENVLLFGFGMAIPSLVKAYSRRLDSRIGASVSLLAFALLIWAGSFYSPLKNSKIVIDGFFVVEAHVFFGGLFVLSGFAFCLYLVGTRPPLLLKGVFCRLGKHSYPLYLYHRFFYGLLSIMGIIYAEKRSSMVVMLLLMPVFYLICAGVENGYGALLKRLERRPAGPDVSLTPAPEAADAE